MSKALDGVKYQNHEVINFGRISPLHCSYKIPNNHRCWVPFYLGFGIANS